MAGSGLFLDEVDRLGCLAIPAIAMAAGPIDRRSHARYRAGDGGPAIHGADNRLARVGLEHKERFLRVVFTPQSKSWLARGAFILIAYSGLCGVFWLAAVLGFSSVASILLWPTVLVGFAAAALYGISFWTMRGPRSLADSSAAGSSICAGADVRVGGAGSASEMLRRIRGGEGVCSAGFVNTLDTAHGDGARRDGDAAYDRQFAIRGASDHAWTVLAGVLGRRDCDRRNSASPSYVAADRRSRPSFPRCLSMPLHRTSRALLALGGLLIFEWCFVMAGQSVPNS